MKSPLLLSSLCLTLGFASGGMAYAQASTAKPIATYEISDETNTNDVQTIVITKFVFQDSIEFTVQGGDVLNGFKKPEVQCTAKFASVKASRKWDRYESPIVPQTNPQVQCGDIQFLKDSDLAKSLPAELGQPVGGPDAPIFYKLKLEAKVATAPAADNDQDCSEHFFMAAIQKKCGMSVKYAGKVDGPFQGEVDDSYDVSVTHGKVSKRMVCEIEGGVKCTVDTINVKSDCP